jgi:hypothetical protein
MMAAKFLANVERHDATLRQLMLTANGRLRLIDLALNGNVDADAALREAIIALTNACVPRTTELAYYEMRLVAGMGPRKKRA